MAKSIAERVASYRDMGFGPRTVAEFERSLRETAEFGPLGFVQRDIDRVMTAITEGVPGAGQRTTEQQNMVTRGLKLVEGVASMPIADARRVRKSLRGVAERSGIDFRIRL